MIIRLSCRRIVSILAASVCLVVNGVGARATLVDFESPGYTAGQNATGQDGWQGKNWATGDPADSTITATGALAGSLSLSYTQIGGNAFDDINRAGWLSAAPANDGTSAPDISVTWLMSGVINGGLDFGLYISGPTTVNVGNSPAGVRFKDSDIQHLATGTAWTNSTPTGFDPGDVMEFQIDLDLDTQVYEAFSRNVTDSTAQASLTGGQIAVFDTGLQIGEEVYIALALRAGTGLIDNINVNVVAVPESSPLSIMLLAVPAAILLGRYRRSRV